VDVVTLNHAARVAVVPPSHAHLLACAPRCGPTSGQHTDGLDRGWTGAHRRAEQGMARATRAWLAVPHHRASTRRVEQTAPAPHRGTAETRSDTELAPSARVVTTPPLQALKHLAVDGDVSQPPCGDGLGALDVPGIGTLRRDAPLRHRDRGPRRDGPGRPKPAAGNVDSSDLARFEPGAVAEADSARYAPVVHPPP
jgi:hypothetical protein